MLLWKYWPSIPPDCSLDECWGVNLWQPQCKAFKKQWKACRILRGMLMDLLRPYLFGLARAELIYGSWSVEPKD
jgi:hypothetical protein